MAVYKNESNNTWYFKSIYYNEEGKKKYVTRRGFNKKRDAKLAEAKFLAERDSYVKNILNPSKMTFKELYNEFYEYKKARVKESTLLTDDNKVQMHLIPFFGDMIITKITVKSIADWQTMMLNNEKNYSMRYLKNIFIILKSILAYGVRIEYLKDNCAVRVGNFVETSKTRKIKEMHFFTYEEYKQFESVLDDDSFKLLFQFLYYTGARVGEALALRFTDFRNNFSEVEINKTITTKTKKVGINITNTKNVSSNRTIAIPDVLKEALNNYYIDCGDIAGFSDLDFVFGIVKPLSTTQIERKKNIACDKANLKRIRIHDFRHSHASFLINNNIPPIYIANRLGHANTEVTLRVYAHLFEHSKDLSIDMLNKVINQQI